MQTLYYKLFAEDYEYKSPEEKRWDTIVEMAEAQEIYDCLCRQYAHIYHKTLRDNIIEASAVLLELYESKASATVYGGYAADNTRRIKVYGMAIDHASRMLAQYWEAYLSEIRSLPMKEFAAMIKTLKLGERIHDESKITK